MSDFHTHMARAETTAPAPEVPNTSDCMNFPSPNCSGEAWERVSRSGCTRSVKCEGCQAALDEILDAIDVRYPDSSTPPSWFDPTYAGESWDGE